MTDSTLRSPATQAGIGHSFAGAHSLVVTEEVL